MKKTICVIIIFFLTLFTTITGFSMITVSSVPAAPLLSADEKVLYIVTETEMDSIEESTVSQPPANLYAGNFSVAAYCGCELCCGNGREVRTYYGTQPTADYTLAADFSVFSPGEKLYLNGQTYMVEDSVSSNTSDSILIYFDSHEKALKFGRQSLDIYRIPDEQSMSDDNLLGVFTVTGYCSCSICTNSYSENGLTFSGTAPIPNHTVAADPDIVPFNSQIQINGTVYTVEDIGTNIKGQRLDIYFETHDEAVIYGRKTEKVYLVSQTEP